jgi:hypothetical protein
MIYNWPFLLPANLNSGVQSYIIKQHQFITTQMSTIGWDLSTCINLVWQLPDKFWILHSYEFRLCRILCNFKHPKWTLSWTWMPFELKLPHLSLPERFQQLFKPYPQSLQSYYAFHSGFTSIFHVTRFIALHCHNWIELSWQTTMCNCYSKDHST